MALTLWSWKLEGCSVPCKKRFYGDWPSPISFNYQSKIFNLKTAPLDYHGVISFYFLLAPLLANFDIGSKLLT